jgi:hypothetical protein
MMEAVRKVVKKVTQRPANEAQRPTNDEEARVPGPQDQQRRRWATSMFPGARTQRASTQAASGELGDDDLARLLSPQVPQAHPGPTSAVASTSSAAMADDAVSSGEVRSKSESASHVESQSSGLLATATSASQASSAGTAAASPQQGSVGRAAATVLKLRHFTEQKKRLAQAQAQAQAQTQTQTQTQAKPAEQVPEQLLMQNQEQISVPEQTQVQVADAPSVVMPEAVEADSEATTQTAKVRFDLNPTILGMAEGDLGPATSPSTFRQLRGALDRAAGKVMQKTRVLEVGLGVPGFREEAGTAPQDPKASFAPKVKGKPVDRATAQRLLDRQEPKDTLDTTLGKVNYYGQGLSAARRAEVVTALSSGAQPPILNEQQLAVAEQAVGAFDGTAQELVDSIRNFDFQEFLQGNLPGAQTDRSLENKALTIIMTMAGASALGAQTAEVMLARNGVSQITAQELSAFAKSAIPLERRPVGMTAIQMNLSKALDGADIQSPLTAKKSEVASFAILQACDGDQALAKRVIEQLVGFNMRAEIAGAGSSVANPAKAIALDVLKNLVRAEGFGAKTAASLLRGSDGQQPNAAQLRMMVQVADKMDPNQQLSMAQLFSRAKDAAASLEEARANIATSNADVEQPGGGLGEKWPSAQKLVAAGCSPEDAKLRIPALALAAINQELETPDVQLTPTQIAAKFAARNGILEEGASTQLEFADQRAEKMSTWIDRAKLHQTDASGPAERMRAVGTRFSNTAIHKSPLDKFVQKGGMSVHTGDVVAQRKMQIVEGELALILTALKQFKSVSGKASPATAIPHFGKAALLEEWSKRGLLVQGLTTDVPAIEAARIGRRAAQLAGEPENGVFADSVANWAAEQTLDTDFLDAAYIEVKHKAQCSALVQAFVIKAGMPDEQGRPPQVAQEAPDFAKAAVLEFMMEHPEYLQGEGAQLTQQRVIDLADRACVLAKGEPQDNFGFIVLARNAIRGMKETHGAANSALVQQCFADFAKLNHQELPAAQAKALSEVFEPLEKFAELDAQMAQITGTVGEADAAQPEGSPAWGLGASAKGSAARAARRQDPMGALAVATQGLINGDWMTMTASKAISGVDPIGFISNVLRFAVVSPVGMSGGVVDSSTQEAIVSVGFGDHGGEIFIGLADRDTSATQAGLNVAIPLLGKFGPGGGMGFASTRMEQNKTGIYLRLPYPANEFGQYPAGPGGDPARKDRLAELVNAFGALAASGEENLLLSLGAQFPDLGISIVSDKKKEATAATTNNATLLGGIGLGTIYNKPAAHGIATGMRGSISNVAATMHAKPNGGAVDIERVQVRQANQSGVYNGFHVGPSVTPDTASLRNGSGVIHNGHTTTAATTKIDGEIITGSSYRVDDFPSLPQWQAHMRSKIPELCDAMITDDERGDGRLRANREATIEEARAAGATPEHLADLAIKLMDQDRLAHAQRLEQFIAGQEFSSDAHYVAYAFMNGDLSEDINAYEALANMTPPSGITKDVGSIVRQKRFNIQDQADGYKTFLGADYHGHERSSKSSLPLMAATLAARKSVRSEVVGQII